MVVVCCGLFDSISLYKPSSFFIPLPPFHSLRPLPNMMRTSVARPSSSTAMRVKSDRVVRSAMVQLRSDICPTLVQQSSVGTGRRRFVGTDQRRSGLVCAVVAPPTTQKVLNLSMKYDLYHSILSI